MNSFSNLYQKLENSVNVNDRVEALVDYLKNADERDKVWAIYLFRDKFPGIITRAKLVGFLMAESDIPEWLISESIKGVGDQIETFSLLWPNGEMEMSLTNMIKLIDELRDLESDELQEKIKLLWKRLDQGDRFIMGRLLSGTKLLSLPNDILAKAIAVASGSELLEVKTEFDPYKDSFADITTSTVIEHKHNVTVVLMNIIKSGKSIPEFGFGVWSGEKLVPIAKVEANLERDELLLIDTWMKDNTIEQYGMAYMVKAELVFELTFADVVGSKRHKSGLKLMYPKILLWDKNKTIKEIDNLEVLTVLLDQSA